MNRKIILCISISCISLLILGIFIYNINSFTNMNRIKDRGIGKEITFIIDNEKIYDYNNIEDIVIFGIWQKSEVNNLKNYMKKYNLKFIPGNYSINQTTTFTEALKIFKFEKIH